MEWIKHDGSGCPLADGTVYDAMFEDGKTVCGLVRGHEGEQYSDFDNNVGSWDWANEDRYWSIVAYRVPGGVAEGLQGLAEVAR